MTQTETLFILGGFLLRLGVPIAVIALVTWFLHRLDARWRAESNTEGLHSPGQSAASAATSSLLQAKGKPCWEVKGCSEAQRAGCDAYAQPSIACWLLHLRRDGRLPAQCRCCEVFGAGSIPVSAAAD